jgi:2-polyprenyl-6-methoxyphenol hydroxylase-like FAD-dependent oxidoreductase
MGLNTGLLDADALAEALIMILLEGKSDELLTIYSDERRQVFQKFVDPTSTANKLRLHSPNSEAAVDDDYYFRSMQDPSAEVLAEAAKPYFETWRTDMRSLALQAGV